MSDERPDGASEVPAEPLDAAAMPKALQGDILAGYMADGVAFTESIRRAYAAGVAAGRTQAEHERDVARAQLAEVQSAVHRLHARDERTGPDGHGLYGCTGCDDGETWPCPTIRALAPPARIAEGNDHG